DALDVLERVDVRGEPRAQILSFTRLGIRKARRPERGDEDRRLGDRARLRIDDVDAAARVVDEELLAGTVLLAHDEIELTPPRAVEITEARVPVATLGMALAVLLPEQLERDPTSLELAVERREVREWSAVAPLRRRVEPRLQGRVVQLRGQGPAEAGCAGARDNVVYRRRADPAARRRIPERSRRSSAIPSSPCSGAMGETSSPSAGSASASSPSQWSASVPPSRPGLPPRSRASQPWASGSMSTPPACWRPGSRSRVSGAGRRRSRASEAPPRARGSLTAKVLAAYTVTKATGVARRIVMTLGTALIVCVSMAL